MNRSRLHWSPALPAVGALVWSGCGAVIERAPVHDGTRFEGDGECAEPIEATRDTIPLGWERSVGAVLDEVETPAAGIFEPVDGLAVDATMQLQVSSESNLPMRFTDTIDGVCRGWLITDIVVGLAAGSALDVPAYACFATIRHDTSTICSGDVGHEGVRAPQPPDDIYQGLSILAWGGPATDSGDDWQVDVEWTDSVFLSASGRSPPVRSEPVGRLFANRR